MQKKVSAALVMVLCVFAFWTGWGKGVAYAEDGSSENSFYGNVELLRQDQGNYVVQVTVENRGEDFSGKVQVVFQAASGMGNCAYETEVTLPSQGKKQFAVTVTGRAVDEIRGECVLRFLDEKGRLLQTIPLKNVLGSSTPGIAVGILSDAYSELTYLDAGGSSLYMKGNSYPLNLIRLDGDSLRGYLEGLYFLVIDQFNVSTLRSEDIRAIQEWVKDGGWLILGTGAYGEQTLSGFEEDFLEMEYLGVWEAGEENLAAENADRYGYYYSYVEAEVDFGQMTIAQLRYGLKGDENEGSQNPAVYKTIGDGAAAVYFCSLGDEQLRKLGNYAVEGMYEELMGQSRSYQSYNRYSGMDSVGQRLLAFIDNRNAGVDFSLLKWLIMIYVVLAGPVLYLVLRKCGKREWYWVGVPVMGLMFIAAVFFLGQGARVNETRVYSVTAQRADSNREDTYFLAYHSGVKPWEVRLEEGYDVAGPGWNGYEGKYFYNTNDYFYRVGRDSKGLYMGIKPQENFDNGFLHAAGRAVSRGIISGERLLVNSGINGGISGMAANGTDCDLAYMAVWLERELMVFKDVKAGETLDLQQAEVDGRCVYRSSSIEDQGDMLRSDMISLYGHRSTDGEYAEEDMAALIIGLGIAQEESPRGGERAVIVGLVKQYDRAIADKCKETSYGCLYGYGETGV